jgi:hypothetical protein
MSDDVPLAIKSKIEFVIFFLCSSINKKKDAPNNPRIRKVLPKGLLFGGQIRNYFLQVCKKLKSKKKKNKNRTCASLTSCIHISILLTR